MRMKIIFKGIFEYISALASAVIFALFLSGRVGWFLVLVFAAAPIASFCFTLLFLKRIEVRGSLSASLVNKGEVCSLFITVKNRLFLPAPQVVIDMAEDFGVRYEAERFCVSVLPLSQECFNVKLYPEICGRARVGVKAIKIRDYLGIFFFKLKNISLDDDERGLRANISVIPDVAYIPRDFWLLKSVGEASAEADDSEDTVESGLKSFGGFPGYESREYAPGDPLKRINWKLSAKRDKLLVRLDDQIQGLFASVVLDSVYMPAGADKEAALRGQAAIEEALGVTGRLSESNYTISFYYISGQKEEAVWVSRLIKERGDLDSLRTALGDYSYLSEGEAERFPFDEITAEKGSVAVFFTPFADEGFKARLTEEGRKNGVNILLYSQKAREAE